MLTNHAITPTSTDNWLYLMLLLLLSLSLSYSTPSIEAFGITITTTGNVASKTTTGIHTQSRVPAYCATRCIDKYNNSKFHNSGGSCTGSFSTCKPHSSLTLSLLSRATAVVGTSSLLLMNSKTTTTIDDDSSSTVNDDSKDNNNHESCANNIRGNNCSTNQSKTNARIGISNVGRSVATTGLVISIVLGGLNYGATTAIAAASTSDEIQELKQLIIESSNKSEERFNKMDERFNKMDERFNKFEKEYAYVPTVTVLAAAFINQYMTDKSIRASEKAFSEKVDRTSASFRSSANVNGGLSVAVIVVFVIMISLFGKQG